MSGAELVEELRRSGTGERKLVAALDLLGREPEAASTDVVAALRAAGISEITLLKAEGFVAAAASREVPPSAPEPTPLPAVEVAGTAGESEDSARMRAAPAPKAAGKRRGA